MRAANLLDEPSSPEGPLSLTGSAASSSGGAAAGAGGGHTVSAFKAASAAAIREYFDSSDADEVAARWDGEAGQGAR